jgi:hypothetical protein
MRCCLLTEAELATLLREYGWYLDMVPKYKTRYAYAKRRVGKTVQTKYLITESKLQQLTREDVLKIIQESSTGRSPRDTAK